MADPTQPEMSATSVGIANFLLKGMSAANTWLYRVTNGRLGGKFPGGAPVLLLTTIGRKSGQRRTTPLLYLEEGGQVVVVASKGGMEHDPLWYKNLVANPAVEIQIGDTTRAMVARTATAEEKELLWPRLVSMYREFQAYQDRTRRNIPIVLLTPATP